MLTSNDQVLVSLSLRDRGDTVKLLLEVFDLQTLDDVIAALERVEAVKGFDPYTGIDILDEDLIIVVGWRRDDAARFVAPWDEEIDSVEGRWVRVWWHTNPDKDHGVEFFGTKVDAVMEIDGGYMESLLGRVDVDDLIDSSE